ncbi:MAG: carboxymuconolactone decarboxylase family protein [Planctomycetota bacterium]
MPLLPPIEYDAAEPAAKLIWDHIKTRDGGDPSVELKMFGRSPAAMRDVYDASTRVAAEFADGPLDEKQIEAIRLAVSSANNCVHCVRAHSKRAMKVGWSEAEVSDILAIAAECAMLNYYHRHRDLVGEADGLPADSGLPHSAITQPDRLEPMLVELICMAVSSAMSCPKCTRYHREQALQLGATPEHLHQTVRAAAVMTLYNTFFRTQ